MSEHADLLTGLHAEPGMHDREWQVVNATGHRICYVQAFSEDEATYLARSIVCAVNFHEELLAACQYLCAEIHNGCNREDEAFMRGVAEAEAIIRKADRSES